MGVKKMLKQWLQDYWRYGIAAVVVIGIGGWLMFHPSNATTVTPAPEQAIKSTEAKSSAVTSQSSHVSPGFVHIKGAVQKPGLYPVDGKTRWDAVVTAAGGLIAKADLSQVNLAKVANDQETLLIPEKGQGQQAAPAQPNAAAASASSGAIINLNTATETQLQTLSGVGPKKAQDIIAYRDEHGGFKQVEELKSVTGIGDKTFEKLAPQVTVGP